MFDPNLISFYRCLVAVPQIAWSAQVNTTASGGKVIISGNHNEVVVSTDRDSRISLAKIKSSWSQLRNRTQSSSLRFRTSLRDCRLWKVKVQIFGVRWRINAYSVGNSLRVIVLVQTNFTIRLFSGRISFL